MDATDALDASAERNVELYVNGWFAVATGPLAEGATPLQRLIHLVGR